MSLVTIQSKVNALNSFYRPVPGSLLLFTLSRVTGVLPPGTFGNPPMDPLPNPIGTGFTLLQGDLTAIWVSKPFDPKQFDLGYGFWLDIDTSYINWKDAWGNDVAPTLVESGPYPDPPPAWQNPFRIPASGELERDFIIYGGNLRKEQITQIQAAVETVLKEFGFEQLPPDSNKIGGPGKFKVVPETVKKIQGLDGVTYEVTDKGEVKIVCFSTKGN